MGLFITFEGIDGAGKSTQLKLLAERLRQNDRDVTVTREPGGSTGAEEIRKLLVEGEPDRWSAETEIMLFTAARRDHVERLISPALAEGKIVLCDRFVDSTRAYQGTDDLRAMVDTLHELVIDTSPALTFVFDMDPEAALRRADARMSLEDRFERKGITFQKNLRQRFRQIADAEPDRCRLIDASGSQDEIANTVWAELKRVLEETH